ncbi:MAG TPA: thymidylate synthase [Thermoanaerobaculia bacterium]|nr:thymidylate synthase [Thermoanaerobaculia bacterium]
MRLVRTPFNRDTFYEAYQAVMLAHESRPRGQLVRDLRGVCLVFDLDQPLLTSFEDRKLNLNYCKREWLWYLGADPYDDSIVEHAKMWAKLKQPDGRYLSNYGQYVFGGRSSQFAYAVHQLRVDPDSRRASIVLLDRDHLFFENVDTVCTYAINFAIVRGRFNMTVHMRSNDVVFGLTNDAFCFSQIAEFAYQKLLQWHPNLLRGEYVHIADSLHVYERHFEMLERILESPKWSPIDVPRPTLAEVRKLISSRGQEGEGVYCDWLKTVD